MFNYEADLSADGDHGRVFSFKAENDELAKKIACDECREKEMVFEIRHVLDNPGDRGYRLVFDLFVPGAW